MTSIEDEPQLAVTRIVKEFLDSHDPPPHQKPSLKGQVYAKLSIQSEESRILLQELAQELLQNDAGEDQVILKKLVNDGEMPYWAIRYLESILHLSLLDPETYFDNNEAIVQALAQTSNHAPNPHILSLSDLVQILQISRNTFRSPEPLSQTTNSNIQDMSIPDLDSKTSSFHDENLPAEADNSPFLSFTQNAEYLSGITIPNDHSQEPRTRSIPVSQGALHLILNKQLEPFEGMDWSNVLLVGADLTNTFLSPPHDPSKPPSFLLPGTPFHWDVCFYGLDEDSANEKVRHINDLVFQNPSPQVSVTLRQVSRDLDFLIFEAHPIRLRISLRLHKSISEALMAQDFDFDAIGFDGRELHMLPRFVHALETGVSVFRTRNLIGNHALTYIMASEYRPLSRGRWTKSRLSRHSRNTLKKMALSTELGQSLLISTNKLERIRQIGLLISHLVDSKDTRGGVFGYTVAGNITDEFGFDSPYIGIDNEMFDQILTRLVRQRSNESDPSVVFGKGDYLDYLTRRIRIGHTSDTLDDCMAKQLAVPILIPEELESYLGVLAQDLPEHLQLEKMLIPLYNDLYKGAIPTLREVHGDKGNARYWITSRKGMWIGQNPTADKIRAVLSDLFQGFLALGEDDGLDFSCAEPAFVERVREYIDYRMQLRRSFRVNEGYYGSRDATVLDMSNKAMEKWIVAAEAYLKEQAEISE